MDKWGNGGPAVILVNGALSDRSSSSELAQLLASRFTVYSFDRRGRGGSTDTKPYSVTSEIEDIEDSDRQRGRLCLRVRQIVWGEPGTASSLGARR
jgi:pimeloyl-ACP methyl ester carboxylesterase